MPAQVHPVFTHPPRQDAMIWRYMDFTKFVSMLEHQGLFMSRVDLLGDPFEGSIPESNRGALMRIAQAHGVPLDTLRVSYEMSAFRQQLRREIYVNCWHLSDVESAAMWSLYSKSNEVIAVQSSFMSLFNQIESSDQDPYYVGAIRYIDYQKETINEGNIFWPFVHKRKSFQHECEVRIVHQLRSNHPDFPGEPFKRETPNGFWKPINLERLFSRIFVSPASDPWFLDLVQKVVARYELTTKVFQSDLKASPVF